MQTLAGFVQVERRFALSARIDSDLTGTPPLTGYILQPSVQKALETMAASLAEGGQCAFTWTGPYGGGKSCAALLVANLVAGAAEQKRLAREIVGEPLADQFSAAFPASKSAWSVLALTGRRADLANELVSVAGATFGWSGARQAAAQRDDRELIEALAQEATARGGLLIILDELGKFFDYAAGESGDVHLLQDLAERAARSKGKLVVVGVLHQAFEQYAERLKQGTRDEWAKVQGRFQNIPFLAQPDEVAGLLARAIVAAERPKAADDVATRVAQAVSIRRPVDLQALANTLAGTWPLHPVTALLLGPVSRQRFAQNERSVFGFLSSAEPHGFKAHLAATAANAADAWFGPDQLWDYLVANFGSALGGGSDGSRISLALEAVERAGLHGALAARLTKAAAVIEFFRNGSGLAVADDILRLCVPVEAPKDVDAAIEKLVEQAILIRQPRLGGYALFSGSDFDLDEAIRKQGEALDAAALAELPARLNVGPIAAKRHYFKTGALRTFEVIVQLAENVPTRSAEWAKQAAGRIAKAKSRSTGLLVLLVPDAQTCEAKPDTAAKTLALALEAAGVVAAVAVAKRIFLLREHAAELHALDRIEASHPQLEGDRIARRQLAARRGVVSDIVRRELLNVFNSAHWWCLGERENSLEGAPLSVVASALADAAFDETPIVHSELLNRDRPSTSAMAGLRALAHAMVAHQDQPELAIRAFPAERGLYLTVLKPFGLHRSQSDRWGFHDPDDGTAGRSLGPAWKILATARQLTLSELYARWAARPIAMKRGIMPIVALAFLLAHRAKIAVYVDGLYQAVVDDVFVDRMMQAPEAVVLRRVTRSNQDTEFMQRLAALLSDTARVVEPDALGVASALYQKFHTLPAWVQRTKSLDQRTQRVRDIVLKANDPEALLFTDLASALQDAPDPAAVVAEAWQDCSQAYSTMLAGLSHQIAEQLGLDAGSFEGAAERAAAVTGVTGDLRLEAFALRVGSLEGEEGDIEGLASMLIHKPARTWSDADQVQAVFELAKLARRFREAEAFAALKGRAPTAQAISVMVGLDPTSKPLLRSFEVSADELVDAERLAEVLLDHLREAGHQPTVGLAALARMVERLSSEEPLEAA